MKSPHLLSSVHDLAICTRSAQTSHKEEDFITTSQTTVSQYSAELSHRQDRPHCRPDDSCRSHNPQFHNSASFAIRFHAESGSGYLLMMLELIFKDKYEGGDETTRDGTTTTQRVGALMAHHLSWMGHHTGPGKDTFGTLVPLRREAGPIHFTTCHSSTRQEHGGRVRRGIREIP